MNISRREACGLIPALLASSSFAADTTIPSTSWRFEDLPVKSGNGATVRHILQGKTHTGFDLEMHETDLAPGAMPHPAHHHAHEEMFLIREGTVELIIAGRASRLGPGSAAYVASNEEHGIRNVGSTHAQYYVIALGSDR